MLKMLKANIGAMIFIVLLLFWIVMIAYVMIMDRILIKSSTPVVALFIIASVVGLGLFIILMFELAAHGWRKLIKLPVHNWWQANEKRRRQRKGLD
ncbi:MAG: hypothetical protein RLY66_312 [Candidatus Parcubacteria bacterium]|jgi:hypothetical protein